MPRWQCALLLLLLAVLCAPTARSYAADGDYDASFAAGAGKASFKLQGQGGALPLPSLPVALPLRLQLLSEGGTCWEATFSTAGTTRNDSERFQARSD